MQKIILITGVSSGFGRAIAERLLGDGHIVYGTSRRELDFSLEGLIVRRLDVTDRYGVKSVVDSIVQEQGRIDVVINNAGVGIAGATELASDEEIDLQMNTNLRGVVGMCAAVLPYMRAKRSGTIINISSIGGVFAIPYQGFYSVSKFAVEALSLETKQFGIRVVIVEPGDFNTGFTANRKVSAATVNDSDYGESFARVIKNIEQDERGGGDPRYLARKISKIVRKRSPRLRYLIAPNFIQKLSVAAHTVLPNRLFEILVRIFYSV